MTNNLQMIHQIVSMLAGEQKISLFTASGAILDLKHNEDYDTAEIVKYLRGTLTGSNAVELNLNNYTKMPALPEIAETLADGGIEITQIIDGKEVQGIFYPKKAQTVVAIAGDVVEVPGLDNLLRHAKRAKEYGTEAIKAFLTRILPVLKDRAHSAEDLMQFIGNSELPLTLDGRVIAYKRLNKGSEGYWKDPHTGSVKQKIGTIVQMNEVDVDSSRFRSCSNGLHVANRSYFGGGNFSAEGTFVVLVNPEDFIAVPKGENGKARVSRYQIIGALSSDAHKEISAGYVKDDDSLARLIANAIEGRYVPATEIAHVGRNGYKETTIIENVETKKAGKASETSLKAARSLDADPQPQAVASVAPEKPMADGVKAVKNIAPTTIPENVLRAFTLLREGKESKAAIARALDTSSKSLDRWSDKYDYAAWKKTMDSAVKADAETETPEDLEAAGEMFDKLHKEAEAARPQMPMKAPAPTKVEIVRGMFNTAKTGDDYKALVQYKKLSKKSWTDLGLSPSEVETVMKGLEAPMNTYDVYMITQDRVISAIKVVRELFGYGLKQAKEIVDSGLLVTDGTAMAAATMTKAMNNEGVVTETVVHGAPRPVIKAAPVKSTVQVQTAPLSKAQQARLFFEQKNFAALKKFKKEAKKSWEVLGFNETEIGQITNG